MGFTFNPKEAISFIAKSVTISCALANGVPPEEAEIAGGLVAGAIKGVKYEAKPTPINLQLVDTISRSVKDVLLLNPQFEIPDDCVIPLVNAFSFDNAVCYLKSPEPVKEVEKAIALACSQSDNCDPESLPLEDISKKLLQQIYFSIINNHELSTLITMVYAEETVRKLDNILPLLPNRENGTPAMSNLPEEIAKSSIVSSQLYASLFRSRLFSETQQSTDIRLCDVYVSPGMVDSNGCSYSSFEEAYRVFQNEDTILVEGEAGSGKSSMLMMIADGYINMQLFQNYRLFFVSGKDIRHSKGEPIGDILKVLGLKSIDSLDHAIVFLDAYDEISYAASSAEKNQEYFRKLIQGAEGFMLVITARRNYIKNYSGPRLRLIGFDPEQRKHFLSKYNYFRKPNERLSNEYIASLTHDDSFYEDDISELLTIPMLIYMIAVNQIDITTISDKYDLYELVFSRDGHGSILSRDYDQKSISKKIWSDSYSLALSIAKRMLFSNDPFIPESKILELINSMEIPVETRQLLKNRFGIEIFLSGDHNSVFTFFHRSIFEYFAAKGICDELKKMLLRFLHNDIGVPQVIACINDIFPADYYSESVFYYIMYAINKGSFLEVLSTEETINNVESLLNTLLSSPLSISKHSTIPYLQQLKNLYLWVFNSFSVMFGMIEIHDDPHWVHINPHILQSLIKLKEPEETLMIAHCYLQGTSFYWLDLGYVYFIDNDLSGAFFKNAICRHITSLGQSFTHINFHSADFWKGNYSGCAFDYSDLRFTDFRDAILTDVSFRGADLRCGSFSGADLTGSAFDGAHLYIEDFSNAIVDDNAFEAAIIHDYEKDDPNDDIIAIYPPA